MLRSMTWPRGAHELALGLAVAFAAFGTVEVVAADASGGAPVGDPLDTAAWAARRGDRAVLADLGADRPTAIQLGAVLAAPWLHAPESCLERLAELAAGRDPRLAPEAVSAAWRIAQALDPRDLAAREVEIAVVTRGRDAFARVAEDGTVRPDIAHVAAFVAAELTGLSSGE